MCPNLKATGALKQQQLEIELQLHGPRQLLMEAECSQHRGCQPSSVPKQGAGPSLVLIKLQDKGEG